VYFVQLGVHYYRDKKVVGVFVRFYFTSIIDLQERLKLYQKMGKF
jgi:hypothetical protein